MARAPMRPQPASGYHSSSVQPLFISLTLLHPLPSCLFVRVAIDTRAPSARKKRSIPGSVISRRDTRISLELPRFSARARIIRLLLLSRGGGGCASIEAGNREEFIHSREN